MAVATRGVGPGWVAAATRRAETVQGVGLWWPLLRAISSPHLTAGQLAGNFSY